MKTMTENITGSCVCSMHREFNLHHNVQFYRFLTTRPLNLFTFHILYFFCFSCFCLMQLFFFLTKNDKKSTRGIQSIFWRQMEWASLASLFIPSCGEFPFQPRKTVILKTVIFSAKTLQLENGEAETSGNFSRWQNLTLNLFKPQYPQTNSSQ